MLRRISFLVALIFLSTDSFAKTSIAEIGDLFEGMVPAYAFGMAVGKRDWEGAKQFGYSFGASQATVHGLKAFVDAERPDGSDNKSFPSGHTAMAFTGATFIHKRYGLQSAVVPYLMAGFTGYSRVYADKHYWHDVVAGAAISSLFTWIFVDKYSNLQVSASPDSVKIRVRIEL